MSFTAFTPCFSGVATVDFQQVSTGCITIIHYPVGNYLFIDSIGNTKTNPNSCHRNYKYSLLRKWKRSGGTIKSVGQKANYIVDHTKLLNGTECLQVLVLHLVIYCNRVFVMSYISECLNAKYRTYALVKLEDFSEDKKPRPWDSKPEKPWYRDSETKMPRHWVFEGFQALCPLIIFCSQIDSWTFPKLKI